MVTDVEKRELELLSQLNTHKQWRHWVTALPLAAFHEGSGALTNPAQMVNLNLARPFGFQHSTFRGFFPNGAYRWIGPTCIRMNPGYPATAEDIAGTLRSYISHINSKPRMGVRNGGGDVISVTGSDGNSVMVTRRLVDAKDQGRWEPAIIVDRQA